MHATYLIIYSTSDQQLLIPCKTQLPTHVDIGYSDSYEYLNCAWQQILPIKRKNKHQLNAFCLIFSDDKMNDVLFWRHVLERRCIQKNNRITALQSHSTRKWLRLGVNGGLSEAYVVGYGLQLGVFWESFIIKNTFRCMPCLTWQVSLVFHRSRCVTGFRTLRSEQSSVMWVF